MGLDTALTLGLDALLGVAGLDAVVTRPAPFDTPVTVRAMWISRATEDAPNGVDFHGRESVHVLAMPRATLPTLPRRTRVVVADTEGAPTQVWYVDRIAVDEPDSWRAVLVKGQP